MVLTYIIQQLKDEDLLKFVWRFGVPPVIKGLIRSMFMATLQALRKNIKNKIKRLVAH